MPSPWENDVLAHAGPALLTKPHPKILEVGGGSRTYVYVEGAEYTALDISKEQLDKNRYASEKILGDAQTVDYGGRVFDACVFWDVLEHVESPKSALSKAANTLSPGGVVVVKGPISTSIKGMVTTMTPRWVHIMFYRLVLKQPNAGKPGYAPFPVEHSVDASHSEIAATLRQLGMEVVFVGEYISTHVDALRKRMPPLYWLYESTGFVIRLISGHKRGGRKTEFVIIAKNSH
ncbi:methyltransferase [Rhizobium sp. J15]|uniref:class I SAM-dependent methyltransferase n=1 Tax=Rhizobium sp. J15 TaxID=2035450 RepID=UPI000BE940CE|nr:class I SAM-dependent methyltransferase [Rhizobium sp. J15]PDT13678.1 methyltransferase [Rhizobium sp. J15]